jgi:hypothetical protein
LRETFYRVQVSKNLKLSKPKEVKIDEFWDLCQIRNNILHKDKERSKIKVLDFLKPKDEWLVSMNLKLYIRLCNDLKSSLSNYLN